MHIFLTGASGLVGANFARAAQRRGHTVTGVVYRYPDSIPGVDTLLRGDLRDEDWSTSTLLDCFPDAIVNAAAISSPEACDADPKSSQSLNVALPTRLAQLANHFMARFIHISSDMVFDGKRGAYSPNDPLSPLSLYGRQKVQAEEHIRKAAPEFTTILRAPILTGNSLGGKRSVHEKLFDLWSRGETAHLFEDEIRQPCSAENLATVLVELCERTDVAGCFHWAGSEALSRLEIGRRILEHFRLPESLIVPASSENSAETSQRPLNLTLDIRAVAGKLKTRPQSFEEQLETFIVPPPAREWFHSL